MVHYFGGEDTYVAQEAIERLAISRGRRLKWIDQLEAEEKEVEEVLQAQGGLFGLELLVLRDVSTWPGKVQEQYLKIIEETKEIVVWNRGKVDRRSKWWKRFGGQAQVFNWPEIALAADWFKEEIEKLGGKIESRVARSLVQRVGTTNRWRLLAEAKKLSLIGEVTETVVRTHVEENITEDVFQVLRAVAAGQQAQALRGVQKLLASGASEFYILTMVAYLLRVLLTIRRGLDLGWNESKIAKEGGLAPFVVSRNRRVAKNWSRQQLLGNLARVLAVDFAIKRGKMPARTGLVMLVFHLSLPTA
jgi:DNA polymerase-3 subunit delta